MRGDNFQSGILDSNFGWGALPPRPPEFWLGGEDPPLDEFSRGAATHRPTAFFVLPLTRAPPEPKKLSRCTNYDSEYDFTIPFFSQSHVMWACSTILSIHWHQLYKTSVL